MEYGAIIAGAGSTGPCLGWRLGELGHRFCLAEKKDLIGQVIQPGETFFYAMSETVIREILEL